jgi:hypothetical protein
VKSAEIIHVRQHAVTLVKSGRQNLPTPSRLTQKVTETCYANASEQDLISLAQRVLREARLTTLAPQTKAEAVSIIEGIRPAGRRYAQ